MGVVDVAVDVVVIVEDGVADDVDDDGVLLLLWLVLLSSSSSSSSLVSSLELAEFSVFTPTLVGDRLLCLLLMPLATPLGVVIMVLLLSTLDGLLLLLWLSGSFFTTNSLE